jgi:hypothetical protein
MQFDDREKAYEAKFTRDQETMFKVEARTSKLVGLWAAEKMGLTGDHAESYAKEVIAANLDEPGYEDVKRKIEADFSAKGLNISSAEITAAIEHAMTEAVKQVGNKA